MLELKPNTAYRNLYKEMLLQSLISEIMANLPGKTLWNIKMRYNNARNHVATDGMDVIAAGYRSKRASIALKAQPPNSPEFNILDLGLFAGIQSLLYQTDPRNLEELIRAVTEAYKEYESQHIDDYFLTLMKCMECSMDVEGGNGHKLLQMKKL